VRKPSRQVKQPIRQQKQSKRSDDFLEARVAAERVPLGKQSRTGKARRLFHVFAARFLLAYPSGDEGEILDHVRPVDQMFRHGQNLHRHVSLPVALPPFGPTGIRSNEFS